MYHYVVYFKYQIISREADSHKCSWFGLRFHLIENEEVVVSTWSWRVHGWSRMDKSKIPSSETKE